MNHDRQLDITKPNPLTQVHNLYKQAPVLKQAFLFWALMMVEMGSV